MGQQNEMMKDAFSRNRAEEFGYDVWSHFVVPLFYDSAALTKATKPVVVIGGRGCGKTMFLRYLSHHSMFSPARKEIPESAIQHIGLYWKADTQFCRMLAGRGLESDLWDGAFDHALALLIGTDILGSLQKIAVSACPAVTQNAIQQLDLSDLRDFSPALGGGLEATHVALRSAHRQFQMWANNPRSLEAPAFLPGRLFLDAMLSLVRQQLPVLSQSRFCVYIDEYENLRTSQQRIINTCIKGASGFVGGFLWSVARIRKRGRADHC